MGKDTTVTIGYKYFLGIHFCLCHGELDALTHIVVDEKQAWSGSSTGGAITFDKQDLFGGEKAEGGVGGTLDFIPGTTSQGQNKYLARLLGLVTVPAYTPPPDGSTYEWRPSGYLQVDVVNGVMTRTEVIGNQTTVTVTQTDGSTVTTVTTFLVGGGTEVSTSSTPAIVEVIDSDVPAYRRIASIVLNQCYVGTNPYLKKWAFRVRRIMKKANGTDQWYPSKAAIGQDMNPVHIIRECLTDPDWGMGYSGGDIDDTAFSVAADTLYSESFGMSLLWDRQATINDFITDVLRHIDAALYVDKSTGKFTLKLIRADYVAANLPVIDESVIISVEDYKSTTFAELSNSVTINYWNSETGNPDSLTVQDIAMVQVQGATVSTTVEYGGCTNGTLAAKLASRDLRALSTPMISCTVFALRTVSQYSVGSVVKLTWPDYGASELIMRIAAIDYGTATESTIKLTLLQDVFAISTATYAPPAATEWVDIRNDPQPATLRNLIEAPYYALVRALGEAEVTSRMTSMPTLGYVFAMAARPTSDTVSAELWSDAGAGYKEETYLNFCATGVTTNVANPTDTLIQLSSTKDFYASMITVGAFAVINTEIVEIVSFNNGWLTIKRGCLDTVPVQHAAGSKIFMSMTLNGFGVKEYVTGETVNVKLLTRTSKGSLLLTSAPSSSVTMSQRANRPYPPGQWKIAGSYFPGKVLDTPLSTTWAHRNRLTQTGTNLVDFTEGDITPETSTTYSIRLYNQTTSALLHSVDGLTGTTYSSFPTMTGIYSLRMELWSVRSSLASLQKHSHVFVYENIYRLTAEDGTSRLMTEDGITLTTE